MTKPTKHVETIAKDIRELLRGVNEGKVHVDFDSPEFLGKFGLNVAKAFAKTVTIEERKRPIGTFYASEVGTKCKRQLWYKYWKPELAEPLSASTSMKFLYGNIIEEVVLSLAELSGHKVSHRQEAVEHKTTDGIVIRGRIDAVIDDEAVIDVKSTSSYGFKDFRAGLGGQKFGYKEQLDFYSWKLALHKKGFLVVEKQLGHIEYCPEDNKVDWPMIFVDLRAILENPSAPSHGRLPTVTEGSNQKLGVECSYCAFKHECWKDANDGKGLRAFQYSGKVVWLTEVKKEPKVPEITIVGSIEDGDG